jgi:hypothetical protein
MFIKTSDQITLESENGEVYKITPLDGSVLIESQPNAFTEEDKLNQSGIDIRDSLEKWHREDEFAKPEFQRNQDWLPEDGEIDDYKFEVLKRQIAAIKSFNEKEKKRQLNNMNSWPLP